MTATHAELAPEILDARALAFELTGLAPTSAWVDAPAHGVVLQPGETAFRHVGAWLGIRIDGSWQHPEWVSLFVTDRRLIARFSNAELASLWWGGVVGLSASPSEGSLVLDFGDGRPRLLGGPALPAILVTAVWALYGPEALITHPDLASFRVAVPER